MEEEEDNDISRQNLCVGVETKSAINNNSN